MPYGGDRLEPYEIAELLHNVGFRDLDLVEMVATVLGESGGYTAAYNDNRDNSGRVISRDVGLGQINIPRRHIGTRREKNLQNPIKNVKAIKRLFDTRETLTKRRRFNPWYAFTKGWATFPHWWVFRSADVAKAQGLPREWIRTGRYIHQAIVGVANFYARKHGLRPFPFVTLPEEPPKPTLRPLKDGPRPKPNKGRGTLGG